MRNPSIFIPLGTRLHMIVRRLSREYALCNATVAEDAYDYEIWTATNTRAGDSSTWLGTYIRVQPDGKVFQCTRTADAESEYQIM